MSQEFEDEIISINAIYGASTLESQSKARLLYTLTLPSHPEIALSIEFPLQYPDVPPSVLGTQTIGSAVAKGEGASFADAVRNVLSEVYTPGAPCLFDMIEEVGSRVEQPSQTDHVVDDEDAIASPNNYSFEVSGPSTRELEPTGNPTSQAAEPPWTLSQVVIEKKSVFIARCAPVQSTDQAKQYLAHLLKTDKKAAKATHNITAWRILSENGIQYQDCDDDGETAAGGRVLHLSELMKVWNVMVVVTRWYGGVQLGPDRFRIINQTAREALVNAGFAQHDDGNAKKKSKK